MHMGHNGLNSTPYPHQILCSTISHALKYWVPATMKARFSVTPSACLRQAPSLLSLLRSPISPSLIPLQSLFYKPTQCSGKPYSLLNFCGSIHIYYIWTYWKLPHQCPLTGYLHYCMPLIRQASTQRAHDQYNWLPQGLYRTLQICISSTSYHDPSIPIHAPPAISKVTITRCEPYKTIAISIIPRIFPIA